MQTAARKTRAAKFDIRIGQIAADFQRIVAYVRENGEIVNQKEIVFTIINRSVDNLAHIVGVGSLREAIVIEHRWTRRIEMDMIQNGVHITNIVQPPLIGSIFGRKENSSKLFYVLSISCTHPV